MKQMKVKFPVKQITHFHETYNTQILSKVKRDGQFYAIYLHIE